MSFKLTSPLKVLLRLPTMHIIQRNASAASCGKPMGDPCKPQGFRKEKPRCMWFMPKCCNVPCQDLVPRMDKLHYKPSNKHRKIQRTWSEGGTLRLVKKKLCCTEYFDVQPMERRDRHVPHGLGTTLNERLKASCAIGGSGLCPKIKPYNCRAGRQDPRCFKIIPPTKCTKPMTPYPSYSECRIPKPKVRLPMECGCLHIRPFCPFGNEKKRLE